MVGEMRSHFLSVVEENDDTGNDQHNDAFHVSGIRTNNCLFLKANKKEDEGNEFIQKKKKIFLVKEWMKSKVLTQRNGWNQH